MSFPNIRLLLFIFFTFFTIFVTTAQLSERHWIPPIHTVDRNSNPAIGVDEQFLYLSTPEAAAFAVTITDGAGNPIPGSPFTLSNATPVRINLGTGVNTYVSTSQNDLNRPLAFNRGLILTASESFYANLRLSSDIHSATISSKGSIGLGTDFRLGSFPQEQIDNGNGFFASVMATENNTVVTINGYDTNVTFEDNVGTISPNVITATLNAGESYVVAGRHGTADNLDGFVGARVTATNPIAVSTGTMLGKTSDVTNGGRDMGMDLSLIHI